MENIDDKLPMREERSFLMARDPSIDRRFRPRPERQVRLFDEIQEDLDEDCAEDASSKTSIEAENNCDENGALVYLRLRPVEHQSTAYNLCKERNVVVVAPLTDSSSTSNNKNCIEKHFSFSEIFDSQVDQKEVYEKCMEKRIWNEENFTVFAYGTSGSGKTFTLLGNGERPGIIPRALENIFCLYGDNIHTRPSLKLSNACITITDDNNLVKEMQLRRKLLSACAETQTEYIRMQHKVSEEHSFQTKNMPEIVVVIWISFVEIYNENVYDLLAAPPTGTVPMAAPPRENLKIVSNDGNVFVKGLTTVFVKNSIEALKLLRYGQQRVTYGNTSINENSSRSHCIFNVDVLKWRSGLATATSYKFCDLAGSERLVKTKNIGSRLKEAQRINTSLLVLGRCLDATNNGRRRKNEVIPFRESKLTMLMQAPLLGKEKLTMIVTITPTDPFYEENLNILGFSSIARNIIFKPPVAKQNNSRYSFMIDQSLSFAKNDAQNEYVEQLLKENAYLRSELDRCHAVHAEELLKQEHQLRNELVDFFQNTSMQNKKQFEIRLQQELECQARMHEVKMASLKRQHIAELEDLREEFEDGNENASDEDAARKRRTLN